MRKAVTIVWPAFGVTITPTGPPNGGNPALLLRPLPRVTKLVKVLLMAATGLGVVVDVLPKSVIGSPGWVISTLVLKIVTCTTALVTAAGAEFVAIILNCPEST